jgi:peptidoglycan/xylan/chitin deacetylase (PgdA/CDA1 family)
MLASRLDILSPHERDTAPQWLKKYEPMEQVFDGRSKVFSVLKICMPSFLLSLTVALAAFAAEPIPTSFPLPATAGPGEIAIPDQKLWPDSIRDRATFDNASRAEILVYVRSYVANAHTPVPDGNEQSLAAWRTRAEAGFLAAFAAAAKDCSVTHGLGCGFTGTTFQDLAAFAARFNPSARYAAWLAMSQHFGDVYLAEQKRLAGLFPKPTSEILPVDPREVFGDRFRDGEFLLTFDDGPTPAGGTTDGTLQMLQQQKLTAQFFALGDALEPRIAASSPQAVATMYGPHCLGSHGYHHLSHQTWADWKKSVEENYAIIQKLRPGSFVPFRPPYGQRTPELVSEEARIANAPVVLWNIDSEDWNDKMPVDKEADRVWKLMLIWRKGVILMHDVHPKAQVVVPELVRRAVGARLQWLDCHALPPITD